MSFVLRHIRGDAVNETFADLLVDRPQLTLGRGADRDILLNDPRVSWEHACIRKQDEGDIRLEVQGNASTVLLNGAPVRGGRLNDGDVISIAGYNITINLLEGRSYVTVEQAPPEKDQASKLLRQQVRLRLSETGTSKRRWSWGLFIGVLLISLGWPLGVRYSDNLYDWVKQSPLPADDIWEPGSLSPAHEGFAANCKNCHMQLFERVPDRACVACHEQMPQHSDNLEMVAASDMSKYRCAACHQEHSGEKGLVLAHPKICTDCHANPDRNMPGSEMPAASDFLHQHPQLSPQRWLSSETGERVDVSVPGSQDQSEEAALIYPHDVHLDAQGVEDNNGDVQVLDCQSCHVYAPGEKHFQPVSFEQHCQSCHSLAFDPNEPDAQVPHGNTQAVLDYLQGFYARKALEGAPAIKVAVPAQQRGRGRSVASERDSQRDTLLKQAQGQAQDATDETIRVRLCATCHTIGLPRGDDTDWDVTPFHQRAVWMTGANFDHSRHKTESCDRCHAAAESDTADDVLMPLIAQCRDCHAGQQREGQKVRSLCVDCHGFHLADHAIMQRKQADSTVSFEDSVTQDQVLPE